MNGKMNLHPFVFLLNFYVHIEWMGFLKITHSSSQEENNKNKNKIIYTEDPFKGDRNFSMIQKIFWHGSVWAQL